MSIVKSVVSFFSVPAKTHCRLEMPRSLRKIELGKQINAEIQTAFSDIFEKSTERKYFVVKLGKGFSEDKLGGTEFHLIEDNANSDYQSFTSSLMNEAYRQANFIIQESTQDKISIPKYIGEFVKSSYEYLKMESIANK